MSDEIGDLVTRHVALAFAGDTTWEAFSAEDIAGMLAVEPTPAFDRHQEAWRLVKSVCESHSSQLRHAAVELTREWPPERNQAAYLFLDFVDHLASVMERTAEAAVHNQQALAAFGSVLTEARVAVGRILDRKAMDSSGVAVLVNSYDEEARTVMVRAERELVEAALHTRDPVGVSTARDNPGAIWPPPGRTPLTDLPTDDGRTGASNSGTSHSFGASASPARSIDGTAPFVSGSQSLRVRSPEALEGLAVGGPLPQHEPRNVPDLVERVRHPDLPPTEHARLAPGIGPGQGRLGGSGSVIGGRDAFGSRPDGARVGLGTPRVGTHPSGSVLQSAVPMSNQRGTSPGAAVAHSAGVPGIIGGGRPTAGSTASAPRFVKAAPKSERPPGQPGIIEAPPEPSFDDPGPGVIGLDR